jgi:hypothetical protein
VPFSPLERVDFGAIEDFDEQYAAANRPVIIAGAALHWPAMSTCMAEQLARRFGDVNIPVRRSDDELQEFFGADGGLIRKRAMMSLGSYLQAIATVGKPGPRPVYAGNINIGSDPALGSRLMPLIDECRFPDWISDNRSDEYRLWIGAAGQRSTIHNDPYHNFNAQIVGRKRFVVFAPGQHGAIYARLFHRGMWVSPVDPRRPDLEKFPAYAGATGFEGELSPGDLLYLPAFWWHHAEARTLCININRWVFGSKRAGWWHEQPEARQFICFEEVLAEQCRRFDSSPKALQDLYRSEFLELKAELSRMMSRERC